MARDGYTTLNINRKTAESLKRLRIASAFTTGRIPTWTELIEDLIADLRKSNPALWATYTNTKAGGGTDTI